MKDLSALSTRKLVETVRRTVYVESVVTIRKFVDSIRPPLSAAETEDAESLAAAYRELKCRFEVGKF